MPKRSGSVPATVEHASSQLQGSDGTQRPAGYEKQAEALSTRKTSDCSQDTGSRRQDHQELVAGSNPSNAVSANSNGNERETASTEPSRPPPSSGGLASIKSNSIASNNSSPYRIGQPLKPLRPNLRRQVMVASSTSMSQPVARVELSGAAMLTPSGHLMKPKRPAHLPAAYVSLSRAPLSAQPMSERVDPAANDPQQVSSAAPQKPNRYAWAQQMHHWHQLAGEYPTSGAYGSAHPDGDPLDPHPHHYHNLTSPFSAAASRVLVVNPMHMVNISEHTKSKLIKFIEAIKRLSEKWFSHVLLLMFLAVYACFGAYIFINFEAPTEHWEKQLIIEARAKMVNDTYQEANDLKREQFVDQLRVRLEDYERLLNRACASGMTSNSLENQWTFWGALFYSMTVFTTIGYGHLTPITFAGRVATMIYAIFGIPILLMVLADLGKLLTRIIKYTFIKFRYYYHKLLHRKESVRTRKLISDNTNQYIGVARGALERRIAYIQPYYDRIPQALRVNSIKRKFDTLSRGSRNGPTSQPHLEKQQQMADLESVNHDPKIADETIGSDHYQELGCQTNNEVESGDKQTNPTDCDQTVTTPTETSDIIVTPPKQTKPVSPKPTSDKRWLLKSKSGSKLSKRKVSQTTSGSSIVKKGSSKTMGAGILPVSRTSSCSNMEQPSRDKNEPNHKTPEKASSLDKSPVPHVPDQAIGDVDRTACEYTKTDIQSEETNRVIEMESGKPDQDENEPMHPDHIDEQLTYLEDQDDIGDLEEDFDIPVSFALFLLVTYMMFGAVVFSIWEGWNFFDSLYFVFISMSTIGFGDLVPQHPKRMIGTFIYLLFGLALTSMCINVVQEKIHATFLRAKMQIGEKMGFDLDQIMADDYHDGSLGPDPNDLYGDDGERSTTNSQTYSTAGALQTERHDSAGSESDMMRLHGRSVDDLAKRSKKTLDTSRWRKGGKQVASLPVGSHQSGGSGSLRRKQSVRRGQQTSARQTSPSDHGPGNPNHQDHPELKSSKSGIGRQEQPSRSRFETVGRVVRSHYETPSMNLPVSLVAGALCTPLRVHPARLQHLHHHHHYRPQKQEARFQIVDRRLTQQVAAPISAQQIRQGQLSSTIRTPIFKSLSADPRHPSVASPSQAVVRSSSNQEGSRKNLQPSIEVSRLIDAHSRASAKNSGKSPRRSSVSSELNQLDDLIVSLSKSPSQKFAPLLGIPSSSRQTRPNSPSSNQFLLGAPISKPAPDSSLARRAISVTSREPPSLGPSPTYSVSLSPSSQSFRSAIGKKAPQASQSQTINLTDSQKALDELEAIKFNSSYNCRSKL